MLFWGIMEESVIESVAFEEQTVHTRVLWSSGCYVRHLGGIAHLHY